MDTIEHTQRWEANGGLKTMMFQFKKTLNLQIVFTSVCLDKFLYLDILFYVHNRAVQRSPVVRVRLVRPDVRRLLPLGPRVSLVLTLGNAIIPKRGAPLITHLLWFDQT